MNLSIEKTASERILRKQKIPKQDLITILIILSVLVIAIVIVIIVFNEEDDKIDNPLDTTEEFIIGFLGSFFATLIFNILVEYI